MSLQGRPATAGLGCEMACNLDHEADDNGEVMDGGKVDAMLDLADRPAGTMCLNLVGATSLRIGYNHAARLLGEMERSGLVGELPSDGTRKILAPHLTDK